MQPANQPTNLSLLDGASPPIHWGHFGIIIATIVLLAGITWMKKPEIFSLNKSSASNKVADANVPHYYPYVAPAPESLVAGANTSDEPGVINEDGSFSPIDMGEVMGASTEDVPLSLETIKISAVVSDNNENIKKYF